MINLSEASKYSIELVGSKAHSLSLAMSLQNGYTVPKGFVVSSVLLAMFENNHSNLNFGHLNLLRFPVIVRSSSNVEDTSLSFAGIFTSEICYSKENLCNCIYNVAKSCLSNTARAYAKRFNLNVDEFKMAVIIQELIEPDISGVMFTAHPVTNDESVLYIEYTFNNQSGVEDGTVSPSSLSIIKSGCNDIINHDVPSDLCHNLKKAGLYLENLFQFPLDIEWVWYKQELFIIQVRKITTLQ